MPQQGLVGPRKRQRVRAHLDRAPVISRGRNLLGQALAKLGQIHGHGLEFHFPSFRPAEEQHVFHHLRHVSASLDDVVQLLATLVGR